MNKKIITALIALALVLPTTATACSDNKRWLVTADSGDDSMLVVWDSISATPVRTFLNPHPGGVRAMDLSMCN